MKYEHKKAIEIILQAIYNKKPSVEDSWFKETSEGLCKKLKHAVFNENEELILDAYEESGLYIILNYVPKSDKPYANKFYKKYKEKTMILRKIRSKVLINAVKKFNGYDKHKKDRVCDILELTVKIGWEVVIMEEWMADIIRCSCAPLSDNSELQDAMKLLPAVFGLPHNSPKD